MLSITVNTLVDENNGVGDLSSVSLREAIAAAASYDNEVIFDKSLSGQRFELTSGQISINQSISILGNGVSQTIIDAGGASRVFSLGASIDVTISGMTITGAYSGANGGGIFSAANLTLQSVNVVGNETGSHGGGLFHYGGALVIENSTFDDNQAVGGGGGVSFSAASLTIAGSTFSNNTAGGGGGGLGIGGTATGGAIAISNSTFSGNVANSGGGVTIQSASGNKAVSIVSSTITDNHAMYPATAGVAGGIYNINPVYTSVTLHNTIVARNTAYNDNFNDGWGSIDSAGASSNNFIGQNYSNSNLSNGDLGNQAGTSGSPIDPLLTPLGDYGGLTKTHDLLPQSLAINAGNSTHGGDFDQRGSQYKRSLGAGVDIGAVEAHVMQATPSSAIYVYGTLGADGILIGPDISGQSVVAIDSTGGLEMPVNLASAASMTVYADDGDDAVSVEVNVSHSISIFGGNGDDLLQGGAGDDEIVGGLGADVLVGGDGDDHLYGSDDAAVVLDDGGDTLFGDEGADTLHVDYLTPAGSPYQPSGGDVFDADGDTVVADSGGYAPTPTGSTWQQDLLWDGNYGFGAGWNVVGIDRLEFTGSASAPTSLQWVRADGHLVTMTRQTTNDPWTAVSGDPSASEITYNATSQRFIRTDKHGNVSEYVLSATGLAMVVRAVDRLGVGRKYAYSDHDSDGATVELDSITLVRTGQVDEVTSYNHSTVSGGYERVTSIVDPFGRTATIEYAYGDGKVSSVKLPYVTAAPAEVNDRQYYRESGNPTTTFTYDGNGFVNQVTDADSVVRDYTWQTNGELWVEDADPNPIRYLAAPSSVYTQWMEKTEAWRGFLPAFVLTDGLAGMGATDVREGYVVDEVGRTTTLHFNRDGGVVWQQDAKGTVTEIVRTVAGLPEQVTVKAPGDQRVVDQTSYDYDASFNLTQATYFDGTKSNWQYEPTFSQITAAIDELGRRTEFGVDAVTGNREEVRIIVGVDDRTSSEANDVVTQYVYTTDGLLHQIVEFRNDVDGSQQLSLVTQFSYTTVNSTTGTGHDSRRLEETLYAGDDPTIAGFTLINGSSVSVAARDDYDNPIEVVDDVGRSTFFAYDILDRLILQSTDDPGFGQLVAAVENDLGLGGRLYAQSFGTLSLGALAGMGIAALTADSSSMTDKYNYCGCDCLVSTSLDSDGEAIYSEYSYNSNNTLESSTGAEGRTTTNTFGPSSSPTRQQFTSYGSGSLASIEGQNQNGPAALVASTAGTKDVLYLYNARDELVAMRDGAGVLTRYEYDLRGRLVRTITGQGSTVERRYNDAGELVATIDGEGRATLYAYDDAGRLVEMYEADRSPDTPAPDPTVYEYDTAGNLRTVVDPLGNTQEYVYDERGRVVESIDANGDSTYFTWYDDNQRHTLTDAEGNTTTWTYDDAGRVHTETNELGHVETYLYDEFNRLHEVEDRNGRTVRYDYEGRLLASETWLDGSATVRVIDYSYRESPTLLGGTSGQLEIVEDTGQDYNSAADDLRYLYSYDDQGRLELTEMMLGGLDASVETLRGYDLGDRIIGTQFSFDASPGYYYAYQDGAVDHENSYAYDSAGRLASLTQTGPAVSAKRVELSYNRAGQFAAIDRYADPVGTQFVAGSVFSYDGRGSLASLVHAQGSTTYADYGFAYDDANRLSAFTNTQHSSEDRTYQYDLSGQLVGASTTSNSLAGEFYGYDDNGNRLYAVDYNMGPFQSYSIGDGNRLSEDDTYTYQYDNEGNVTGRWETSDPGQRTYYTWDHRNRLVHVSEWDGDHEVLIVDYGYDAFNQLVSRRIDEPFEIQQSSTFLIYDNGQIVLQFEKDGAGNLDAGDLSNRYLWGPTVDQLFADEQVDWSDSDADGETLWALTDHLGSVRDFVDDAGVLQNHKSYDAFGNVTAETNAAVDTAFGYTGKLFDDATGLQNNLNRWYDPAVGRWLSEDPIGFGGGDTNLYRYVENQPTTAIDPSGLWGLWDWWYGNGYFNTEGDRLDAQIEKNNLEKDARDDFEYAKNFRKNQFTSVENAKQDIRGLTDEYRNFLIGAVGGQFLDKLQDAKRALARNKDFEGWMHRNCPKTPGAGRSNPDWTDEELVDGWDEWNDLGQPPRP